MNQKKLKTIKTYKNISVTGKLPIALDNLDQAKFMLHNANKDKSTTEMIVPTIYVVEAKESLKIAKKNLNDAIKAKQEEAKSIDLALKDLEAEVKKTALGIVKITKTLAKDRSGNIKTDKNGEPIYKETHNLNTTMFKYTPTSVAHEVDREKLLEMVLKDKDYPAYKNLLKEEIIYTIDNGALNDLVIAGTIKLPMKKVVKPASIAINASNILKGTKELLALTEKKEEE